MEQVDFYRDNDIIIDGVLLNIEFDSYINKVIANFLQLSFEMGKARSKLYIEVIFKDISKWGVYYDLKEENSIIELPGAVPVTGVKVEKEGEFYVTTISIDPGKSKIAIFSKEIKCNILKEEALKDV